MQCFSRWFRNPDIPRVSITLVAAPVPRSRTVESAWETVFDELEPRGLAATWAIANGQGQMPLLGQLVASQTAHELAFDDCEGSFEILLPKLQNHAELARRVRLPLRTLVSRSGGVHPSLLTQLHITAQVPISRPHRSRTGSLKAVGWSRWEVPITDTLTPTFNDVDIEQLRHRVHLCLRKQTHMRLLWIQPSAATGEQIARIRPLLDGIGDYHSRGWLRVETAGQAADAMSRSTTASAA